MSECKSSTVPGNPNVSDSLSSGNTALHFAAAEGHLDCLRLLLQNHGDATLLNAEVKTCLGVAPPESKEAIAKMSESIIMFSSCILVLVLTSTHK